MSEDDPAALRDELEAAQKRLDELERSSAYYRRQLDQLAGQSVRQDSMTSTLKHQLRQRQQGFTVLSELTENVGRLTPSEDVIRNTLRTINGQLKMDRSILLARPDPSTTEVRPVSWAGWKPGEDVGLGDLTFEFPPDFGSARGHLISNKGSEATDLVAELRWRLKTPFFICVPVVSDSQLAGVLLS